MIFTSKKFRILSATAMSLMLFSCEVSSGDGVSEVTDTPSVPDTPDTPDDGIYKFHSTVTYLDAGTDGTAGTNRTYCLFGDWPQTIKEQDVEVDETQAITMGGATYYLGSDKNYYAKCTENASNSRYTYSDGTSAAQKSSGSEKYFKVEPIKWRVLNPNATSDNKILLAEKALTANVAYYGSNSMFARKLNNKSIYANNYKYSNIRAYLNGTVNQFVTDGGTATDYDIDWTGKGFLQTAFTSAAQGLVADTEVDNSAESTNPASDSNLWNEGTNNNASTVTKDKIFLLSEKEVTTSGYGFAEYNVYVGDSNGTTESCRIRKATDYAIANYAFLNIYDATLNVSWWLRSPAWRYNYRAYYGGSEGNVSDSIDVDDENISIVPALSISAK